MGGRACCFPSFVRCLLDEASPEKVRPGWVPCTHYWLVINDGWILGTSRLRVWLVPHLEEEGGHSGYEVRACERGKGYGTQLLALTLERALGIGLSRALVACNEVNVASRRVIERNRGALSASGIFLRTGKMILGYRIELARSGSRENCSSVNHLQCG